MDDTRTHCPARRLVPYMVAIAGALAAPAALQAGLILRPDVLGGQHAAAAMSLALSAVVIGVPALLRALFAAAEAGHRQARPIHRREPPRTGCSP